ncbi:hypothetical protein [Streptomyces sp. NPDC093600]|uniref:hypothetical protein n=1 Tax=Streptomyces sp. NPDC093600 TaxID=3366047 RepID=UPI00381A49BE
MANQPVRVAAAARAAAKRAEKARRAEGPEAAASPAPPVPVSDAEESERPEAVEDAEAGEAGEVGEVAEVAEAGADVGGTPSRRRRGRLVTVLAVLVVVGLTATTLLGLRYREAVRTDQARTSAVAAARTAAPVILSYDYRHLDRDFAAARRHLTGPFLDEYEKTTTTVVAPTAKKYQGVVKASVAQPPGDGAAPAVSVVSASPDEAVVLLFMNQVTDSTQVSGPRVDLNRVRMTIARTAQGWKVSAVDAL